MKQAEIKTKAIRSKRIAWLLRMEGFRILTIRPDRRNPQYDLYFFKVTPRFEEALSRIMEVAKQRKQQKNKDEGTEKVAMKNKIRENDYIKINVPVIYALQEKGITNYGAVLLYSKILSMADKTGYCTASNGYFADTILTGERNIKKYLQKLKEVNAITVFEDYGFSSAQ